MMQHVSRVKRDLSLLGRFGVKIKLIQQNVYNDCKYSPINGRSLGTCYFYTMSLFITTEVCGHPQTCNN